MSSRLLAILFSGLAIGSLGLLEPLLRFWDHFHLLGMQWPRLLLLYLGGGVLVAVAAGLAVTIGMARRAARWRTVAIASYYVAATIALAAVLVLAPILRRESIGLQMPISYTVLLPVLIVIAAVLTVKVTPHLVQPLLSTLIGQRSGHVARLRLTSLLVVIGLLVPITIAKDLANRHRDMRPPRPEMRSRPGEQVVQNVLLITIDALRADHLGLYGYERDTSPEIDALGEQGVVFDHCYAQGNSTELSMGALFTSLYPSMHTVKRYGHIASALPLEIETLAEHLRDAGLHTVGLMNNPFIKREWGLTQGFAEIEEFHNGYEELLPIRGLVKARLMQPFNRIPETRSSPRAVVMADAAIRQLRRLQDRPFFLHVHFMDVHHPYIPPVTYQKMFISAEAARTEAVQFWKRGWPLFNQLPTSREVLSAAEVQRIIDLYDGCIRFVDAEVARILSELERLDLSESTLVILTSDHGDEFVEHGNIFHKSPFLYDELTHVPLIIRHPEYRSGRRVENIVRLIDVMPTLLEIFDLPGSAAAQGRSLVPLISGTGLWRPVAAFSESYEFMAVRTADYKLMHDRRSDDRRYCFELGSDPGELTNIYDQVPVADSLDAALDHFLRLITVPPPVHPTRELDERTQEQLRSIGYM